MCGLAMAGPGLRPQRSWRTCSTIHGQETPACFAGHRECQAHFVRAFCVDFLWMCLNLCLTCACQHHSVQSHLLCGLLEPACLCLGLHPARCSRVCGAQGRGLHVTAAGCLQHHGADARGGGGGAADRALGQGAQRLRLGWRKAVIELYVGCDVMLVLCANSELSISRPQARPASFLGQRRGRRTDLGVRPRHIQLLPGGIPSASDQEPHCTPPN